MKPYAVMPCLMLMMLVSASCQHTANRADNRVDSGVESRPPAPAKILLLENPKRMHEAYTYPQNVTQQAFYWKDNLAEWRIKMAVRGYGHAGFRFSRAHNLLAERKQYELIFDLEPAFMARYLWIGLVDGDDRAPQLMTDLPLSAHINSRKRTGKLEVRIPLSAFPDKGIPVSQHEAADRVDEAAFDWYDVREIRFIHNGGRLPPREISITNLRFVR